MHFAEFLSKGSLERLRILTQPTCVGLGTVTRMTRLEIISWQHGFVEFALPWLGSYSPLGLAQSGFS